MIALHEFSLAGSPVSQHPPLFLGDSLIPVRFRRME